MECGLYSKILTTIPKIHNRECIIVCVKAKFVDTVRARSGHPIGGFIPTWQNAK